MSSIIVHSKNAVSLVGGGVTSSAVLETLRVQTSEIVAADGGARHALAAGLMPDAVIGDLDSLDAPTRAGLPPDRIYHVAEQDSTDFEKCLAMISAPLILGAGFLGARIDHELACFHALLVHAHKPVILMDDRQIVFLCPSALRIDLEPGALVSLFPLVPVQARSDGLYWPVDGLDLAPGRMIGTSNRATEPTIELSCNQPGLLVILPGPALPAARAALLKAAPWPARAK